MKWGTIACFMLVLANPLWACQGASDLLYPSCSADDAAWMDTLAEESQATIQQTFSQEKPQASHPDHGKDFFVLISFSMPKSALLALAKQVEVFDGVLVLRGLVNNSIKQTQTKVFEVFGEQYAPRIVIDPLLFQRFAVARVPSFVVCADDVGCRGERCPTIQFDKVSGNMPMLTALRVIAEEGEGKSLARAVLARGPG